MSSVREGLNPRTLEKIPFSLGNTTKKALGSVALTLALLGAGEVYDSQPAEAQTLGEESDSEYAPECLHGYYPIWISDKNSDGQPGPRRSEFTCRPLPGCTRIEFIPASIMDQFMEAGIISPPTLLDRGDLSKHIGWCRGEPWPTFEDYSFDDSTPWVKENIERILASEFWDSDQIKQSVAARSLAPNTWWWKRVYGQEDQTPDQTTPEIVDTPTESEDDSETDGNSETQEDQTPDQTTPEIVDTPTESEDDSETDGNSETQEDQTPDQTTPEIVDTPTESEDDSETDGNSETQEDQTPDQTTPEIVDTPTESEDDSETDGNSETQEDQTPDQTTPEIVDTPTESEDDSETDGNSETQEDQTPDQTTPEIVDTPTESEDDSETDGNSETQEDQTPDQTTRIAIFAGGAAVLAAGGAVAFMLGGSRRRKKH